MPSNWRPLFQRTLVLHDADRCPPGFEIVDEGLWKTALEFKSAAILAERGKSVGAKTGIVAIFCNR